MRSEEKETKETKQINVVNSQFQVSTSNEAAAIGQIKTAIFSLSYFS